MSKLAAGIYHGKLIAHGMIEVADKPAMELKFNLTHVQDLTDASGWQAMNEGEEANVLLFLNDAAYDAGMSKLKKLGFNYDIVDPEFAKEHYDGGIELKAIINAKGYNQWSVPSIEGGSGGKPVGQDILDVLQARMQTDRDAATPPAAPATAAAPAA